MQRGLQAIELAQRHGWGGEPSVAIAYPMLAASLIWQGKLDEAERWLMEGEYALRSEVEPATGMLFHLVRGFLEIARGRAEVALAALHAVEHLAPGSHQVWLIAALLLEASARDAHGEREAAGRALERGLDLAEPDGLLFPFLLHPASELLERHARQRTAHPALIRKIVSVLAGRTPAAPAAIPRSGRPPRSPRSGRRLRPPRARQSACPNRSARPRPASCASCRPACPRRRSPASSMCR